MWKENVGLDHSVEFTASAGWLRGGSQIAVHQATAGAGVGEGARAGELGAQSCLPQPLHKQVVCSYKHLCMCTHTHFPAHTHIPSLCFFLSFLPV